MQKPIIGITTRIITNELDQNLEKIPQSLIKKVYDNGGIPLIIPKCFESYNILKEKCDGYIIPGGSSWHEIDELIIKDAIMHDIPLLGICAGMQAIGNINNFVGSSESDKTIKVNSVINHNSHDLYVHEIILNKGMLYDVLKENKILVNSRHNDCVVNDESFKVEASSSDGIIEAISLPNKRFIMGVQWHPEDLDNDASQKIFSYFISKCQKK